MLRLRGSSPVAASRGSSSRGAPQADRTRAASPTVPRCLNSSLHPIVSIPVSYGGDTGMLHVSNGDVDVGRRM